MFEQGSLIHLYDKFYGTLEVDIICSITQKKGQIIWLKQLLKRRKNSNHLTSPSDFTRNKHPERIAKIGRKNFLKTPQKPTKYIIINKYQIKTTDGSKFFFKPIPDKEKAKILAYLI